MKTTFNLILTSLLIGVTLSLISSRGSAQETHLKLLVNGVTTNFNYGKSNSDLQSHKKNVMGLQAGVSFQAGISKKISLVTESYYIRKGGTLKANHPEGNRKSTIRLHSVEMPVLARLHFGRMYLNAGPYVAYALGGEIKKGAAENLSEESSALYFNNAQNGFNRWDMGFQAGGGYIFKLNKSSVTLDLRYGYGLTSLSHDVKRYNRMLNISVTIYNPWNKNPLAKK